MNVNMRDKGQNEIKTEKNSPYHARKSSGPLLANINMGDGYQHGWDGNQKNALRVMLEIYPNIFQNKHWFALVLLISKGYCVEVETDTGAFHFYTRK